MPTTYRRNVLSCYRSEFGASYAVAMLSPLAVNVAIVPYEGGFAVSFDLPEGAPIWR